MWRKQVYSSRLRKIAIVGVDISEKPLFVWVAECYPMQAQGSRIVSLNKTGIENYVNVEASGRVHQVMLKIKGIDTIK